MSANNALLGVNKVPGLAISLNGNHVATVSTEGLNVVGVRIHGDVIGPEFATIDVSGGLYEEGREGKHFIWIEQRKIAAGDEVEVTLLESAVTSPPGRTIEELYPENERPTGPAQSVEQVYLDLLKRPRIRESFIFQVVPPTGEPISARTSQGDHSFGFSVMWDWLHPERVRVSLSSNSLENIVKRTGGTDHANFFLQYGEGVKLRVDA